MGIYSGWLTALVVFGMTAILVEANVFGAGDSKLATVLALALPLSSLPFALWLTVMVGGGLAVFYWLKYRLIKRKLKGMDPGLPYGLAIAIGFYIPIIVQLL
ncbi:hypothetical protein ABT56_01725 [Photobacterium aquae]|uniref:Prepilin type IV endopeptidase peptidase domain-containing protein n=2 Tax=Photobacterium aquae TaxID=1195763 RepID=A0A0J1HBB4_9GAMM|nr:hypothetical protein ABT56_01725 [Photobacterium aquae]